MDEQQTPWWKVLKDWCGHWKKVEGPNSQDKSFDIKVTGIELELPNGRKLAASYDATKEMIIVGNLGFTAVQPNNGLIAPNPSKRHFWVVDASSHGVETDGAIEHIGHEVPTESEVYEEDDEHP